MDTYEVIVKQYSGGRAWGLDLRCSERAFTVDAVLMLASPHCRKGFAVIVRPERLGRKEDLHEWRSFDGEQFRKVVF